jgi:hypothetical protein
MRQDLFVKMSRAENRRNPSSISSGLELLDAIALNMERNLATQLENSERLEKCKSIEHFAAARSEWFAAWRLLYQRHGLTAAALDIRTGKQQTLEGAKAYILAMLRTIDQPEVTLQKMAGVIYAAAHEGDVDFFRKMGLAFRARKRSTRGESSFLAWNILRYWFAGLLWLMNPDAGSIALRQYTGRVVSMDAYRKARERLGLKGYETFADSPPVLAYHPRKKAYAYAPSWTRLEPN